jgi:hypothetical protein
MSNETLIGCPFCGRIPEIVDYEHDGTKLTCLNTACPAEVKITGKTLEEATAKWNKRRHEQTKATPDLIECVKEAIMRNGIDIGNNIVVDLDLDGAARDAIAALPALPYTLAPDVLDGIADYIRRINKRGNRSWPYLSEMQRDEWRIEARNVLALAGTFRSDSTAPTEDRDLNEVIGGLIALYESDCNGSAVMKAAADYLTAFAAASGRSLIDETRIRGELFNSRDAALCEGREWALDDVLQVLQPYLREASHG